MGSISSTHSFILVFTSLGEGEKWSNNKQKKFGFISEACRLTHRGGIPTAHLPPRIGCRSSGMNLFARNKREKECKHAHLNSRLPPPSEPYRAACAQQADFRQRVGVKWSKTHFHLICVFLWQIRQPASCFSFSNDDIIFVVRARPLPSLRHKRERTSTQAGSFYGEGARAACLGPLSSSAIFCGLFFIHARKFLIRNVQPISPHI